MRSRIQEAVDRFESGYNCCQAVFVTYADLYGVDQEMAIKLTSTMGAGIGRMREVCGAVSAMALLIGLKQGNTDPTNQEAKTEAYALVREMSDLFQQQTGSIVCRELLGLKEREESAKPEPRTPEYYNKRPCSNIVANAARIIEENIIEEMID